MEKRSRRRRRRAGKRVTDVFFDERACAESRERGRYGDVQQLEHLNVDRHRFPIITTSSICELELIIDIVWSVVSRRRRHKNKIVFVDPLFPAHSEKKKTQTPFSLSAGCFCFVLFRGGALRAISRGEAHLLLQMTRNLGTALEEYNLHSTTEETRAA